MPFMDLGTEEKELGESARPPGEVNGDEESRFAFDLFASESPTREREDALRRRKAYLVRLRRGVVDLANKTCVHRSSADARRMYILLRQIGLANLDELNGSKDVENEVESGLAIWIGMDEAVEATTHAIPASTSSRAHEEETSKETPASSGGGSSDRPSSIRVRAPLLPTVLDPILSASECAAILATLETHVTSHGFTTSRHGAFSTTDVPVSHFPPGARDQLSGWMRERVLAPLEETTGFPKGGLGFRDLFVVSYDAVDEEDRGEQGVSNSVDGQHEAGSREAEAEEDRRRRRRRRGVGSQRGLALHMDGSLLSFSLLLNDPASFTGGGTHFSHSSLSHTFFLRQGAALLHDGKLEHAGVDISDGRRVVLVGFVEEVGVVAWDERRGESEGRRSRMGW